MNEAGTHLSGVYGSLDEPTKIVRVNLTTHPAKVATVRVARQEVYVQVFWLPAGRLLFLPTYNGDTARVLDASLRTRSRFRWTAGWAALGGKHIFGIDQTHSLYRAELPSGPQRIARHLPGRPTLIVAVTR